MRRSGRRWFECFRVVARCHDCGEERLGETTVEHRPWAHPSEHRYHYCDECCDAIIERPLDAVLADYLHEDNPR